MFRQLIVVCLLCTIVLATPVPVPETPKEPSSQVPEIPADEVQETSESRVARSPHIGFGFGGFYPSYSVGYYPGYYSPRYYGGYGGYGYGGGWRRPYYAYPIFG